MKLSTQIILAFTLIILLSAADSYSNYRLSLKVNQNSAFLSKSEEVIRNSNKTHRAILQMQSAVRGYLLTNDSTYLVPYYSGIEKVPGFIVEQHTLIDSNSIQASILDSISVLHSEWLSYTSELIRARRENPTEYLYLLDTKLKKHIGKNINDSITKKFRNFERIEYKARAHHSEMLLHSLKKQERIR
ncbi:CHASE3 domain-containing protein [Flavobacterium sp. P21]|uniref:CHASE3 domain-containing protein n=1 Tax=Flavobacterium sp. P21 TaxID=3423948 RepID=UPI003D67340C